MVAQFMQDKLIKLIQSLFYNKSFLSQYGEFEGVKVFAQDLPVESNREDDEDNYPCIVVKLLAGDYDVHEPYKVKVNLIMATYSENRNRKGSKDLLHLINVFFQYFQQNPLIGKEFVIDRSQPITWEIWQDDYHPYYYGGIEFIVNLPTYEMENAFT